MRKHIITAVLAAALTCVMAVPAFAGMWVQDNAGLWHYDYLGRGVSEGYLKGQWAWIDSNYDGTSQCYYFDANGNMAANTVIDGYTVNGDGKWVVDGVIQDRKGDVGKSAENVSKDITTEAPAESNYYTFHETAATDSGLQWNNCFELSGSSDHAAYALFNFDGVYSDMTITFAPKAGQTTPALGRVTVTGANSGKKLYRSEEIGIHSAPVSITFNCQRDNGVRINVVRGFDILFSNVGLIK